MKRFHVHVGVSDLASGIRFYSTLFGAPPAVEKRDYAKWMLDEPRLNFAISQRGGRTGLNHLGFQVDSDEELETLHGNLEAAGRGIVEEKGATCCYARSDKYWVTDPAGIAWESFHSLGSIPVFGEMAEGDRQDPRSAQTGSPESDPAACCASATASPSSKNAHGCCAPEGTANAAPSTKRARCCA